MVLPGMDGGAMPANERPTAGKTGSLREVAEVFLKLGLIGFGGPAATIALMRDEVVARRRWVTDATFLDLVGASNLIPGSPLCPRAPCADALQTQPRVDGPRGRNPGRPVPVCRRVTKSTSSPSLSA